MERLLNSLGGERSKTHILHILDDIDLQGPNRSHKYLVFEFLGPNIPDLIDRIPDGGWWAAWKLAKVIARKALLRLAEIQTFLEGMRTLKLTVPNNSFS